MNEPSPPMVEIGPFDSGSEEETRQLGCRLGRILEAGDRVGLRGELGAGKTVFVRGLAEGLGVPPHKVRSPTFTLVNEYSGGRLPLYHLDLYRMAPTEADELSLREYLYGDGVSAIEWWERLADPDLTVEIDLTLTGEGSRRVVVRARNPRYGRRLMGEQDR